MMSTLNNQSGGSPPAGSSGGALPRAAKKEKAHKEKAQGAFRTISEVADDLRVPQHVLRFWETKFTQVKPLKRGGGRRYYRPEDVTLLRKIHHLLYTEGYTIKGVQKLLKGQGRQQAIASEAAPEQPPANQSVPVKVKERAPGLSEKQRVLLQAMLGDLKELRDLIRSTERPPA